MSRLTEQAIAKMAEEIKGKDYLIPFEEYLTEICTTDEVAEKILDEKKSLQKCFEKMKDIARERKVGGFAYIPPEEGFTIIRRYYEISVEKPKRENVIDIMDLL